MGRYVIVTPARNEERFISRTLHAVMCQTVRPLRWVIVNDGSTDGTAEVVVRYQARCDFIELLNVDRSGDRHFGNKVHAFNLGVERVRELPYDFIGNLDADISFDADYFETLLREFRDNRSLGLAGGAVTSQTNGRFVEQDVSFDSVAGAVQLFRRDCFEQVGGYVPLPLGGIDAVAEIVARMNGWTVQTVRGLRVFEHRRTGSAHGGPLTSRVREGRRLHSLGYDWRFFLLRCAYRSLEPPPCVGSCAAMLGFLMAKMRRESVVLAPEVVQFLRQEQRGKLRRALRLSH